MPPRRHRLALACLLTLAAIPLRAHDGPPFPIALDRPAGPYLLSIWTDPDVGTGLVYVVLEAPAGSAYVAPRGVHVGIRPVSGRLSEVTYEAVPEPVRRGGRYLAAVSLDRAESWRLRAVVQGPAGGGEVSAEVEATPAGSIGPIGLVVYALPFVLLGAMWIRVTIARRRMAVNHD